MIYIITLFSFFIFSNALSMHTPPIQMTKIGNFKFTPPKTSSPIKNYLTLFRANNVFPVTVLSFTGGIITNPHIKTLLYMPAFLTSVINTNFVMISSMVLNDLYDYETDKINNPTRPLITGEISKRSAIIAVSALLFITEVLTFKFLPVNLQLLMQMAIVTIIIYTPIFKRIPLIKNVSCASLVAFSLYFNGLSTNTISISKEAYNRLAIASRTVFFGSLVNEILLDIRDSIGDKANGIYTIPVIYGNNKAWLIAYSFLTINMIWNIFAMQNIYGPLKSSVLLLAFLPLYMKMHCICNEYYSNMSIVKYMNQSTTSMFIILALVLKK